MPDHRLRHRSVGVRGNFDGTGNVKFDVGAHAFGGKGAPSVGRLATHARAVWAATGRVGRRPCPGPIPSRRLERKQPVVQPPEPAKQLETASRRAPEGAREAGADRRRARNLCILPGRAQVKHGGKA
jgi:hypothetical protein